jgi:ABC-type polysaccharide/polyol phosphate export permease
MILALSDFVGVVRRNRSTIWIMATRELASRYVGTLAGPLWTLLQPAATVAVFWFVFSVGFKAQGPAGVPFIVYFLCGYVPWLYFTEVVQGATGSVVASGYLVKKTGFSSELLPVIHATAAVIPQLVLLAILTIVVVIVQGGVTMAALGFIYYFACLVTLCLAVGWFTAGLNVFNRDVAQVVGVLLNLWFWITPIAWPESILPERVHWITTANPMYYVITGYRASFLGVEHPQWVLGTLVFWGVTLPLLLVGAQVFRRLKPEFADAL